MKDSEIIKQTNDVIQNVIINYSHVIDEPKTLKLIERGVAICISPWLPSEFDEIRIVTSSKFVAFSGFNDLCVDVDYICNGLGSTGRNSITINYVEGSMIPNMENSGDELFEFTLDDLDLDDIQSGSRELEL